MGTPNLNLALLTAAQTSKHITHNDALSSIDTLLMCSVKDRNLAAPPGSPTNGDRYLIATSPTGAWSGYAGYITAYQDGAWRFNQPKSGWRVWVEDEGIMLTYANAAWVDIIKVTGHGAYVGEGLLEELITVSSGAYVDSTILFPIRSIMLCVACRTVTDVTGASSYDCGINGDTSKFGSTLNVTAGSTNIGVIGPTAVYADTAIRLTANSSNFTGGTIRIAASYLIFGAPTS